ncbi:MAG: hypothetical protein J6Y77_07045 [Paludibacteraceae bacterium]|nr:hypothetical protein [Paludibacteraceae bacterium]
MKRFVAKFIFLTLALAGGWSGAAAEDRVDMGPVGPAVVSVHQSETLEVVYVEATCSLPCSLVDSEGHVLLECGLKIGMTAVPTASLNAGVYLLKVGNETFHIVL